MTRSDSTIKGADEAGGEADAEAAMFARSVSPYTTGEKIKRLLWNSVGQRIFSFTFHNFYGVRNALLRAFGASVGAPVRIRPSVVIEQPWNLTIGDNSSIGDRAIVYCLGK